jgi:hypothetical protein
VKVVGAESLFDTRPQVRLKEKLGHRGGINDDHAESRSFRMIWAAGVLSLTGDRACSRASISSRVGRAAMRSISASK